jgi:hypothetical protein
MFQVNGISYVLNVSNCCPMPTFIQDGHFLRIPVNDNYSEKMAPYFHEAFQFLGKTSSCNHGNPWYFDEAFQFLGKTSSECDNNLIA